MSCFLYSNFEIIHKFYNALNSYLNVISQVIFSSRIEFLYTHLYSSTVDSLYTLSTNSIFSLSHLNG